MGVASSFLPLLKEEGEKGGREGGREGGRRKEGRKEGRKGGRGGTIAYRTTCPSFIVTTAIHTSLITLHL